MKKLICLLSLVVMLTLVAGTANAATILLNDWRFNPSGTGILGLPGVFFPIDEITFLGTALVDQPTYPAAGAPFSEYGAFTATDFENDSVPLDTDVTKLGSTYQITGVLTGNGVNTTLVDSDQDFVFTTAHLDMYLDATKNYGSTTGFYGADDGVLIASFDLLSGSGDLDFGKVTPDGSVDILFKAGTGAGLNNGLRPGVWFDSNGVDLSTFGPGVNIALSDSNNNVVIPNETQGSEWFEKFSVDGTPSLPNKFWTRSDGSYKPGVVPEPASMLLFGMGVLGLASSKLRRKKVN